jgi:hypothetical protein
MGFGLATFKRISMVSVMGLHRCFTALQEIGRGMKWNAFAAFSFAVQCSTVLPKPCVCK